MSEIKDFINSAYTETLHVDCNDKLNEIKPFWNAVGFDRFYDILKPEMQPVWKAAKELNLIRSVRCHEIFRADECERENWDYFIDQKKCIDILLDSGIKPFVELSKIPDAFANPDHPLGFCGDLKGWSAFLQKFIAFLVNTYGLEEIEQWYFEFWNEPDHFLWAGAEKLDGDSHEKCSANDYFIMYDWTVDAIKKQCPSLKVGGMALTGNTIFFRDFLKHCASGKNYCNGKVGSALDFVSVHAYSNSPERSGMLINLIGKLGEYRNLVDTFYDSSMPLLLTEWGVTWGGGRTVDAFPVNHRNTNESSVFTLKFIKELIKLNYDYALFWGFSEWAWKDRSAGAGTDFSGHRSLYNYSGTERPVLGAYRFLNTLKGNQLYVHRMVDTNNVDGLASIDTEEINFIFWHHDNGILDNEYYSRTEISLSNIPEGFNNIKVQRFTKDHNTYAAWQKLNTPAIPTQEKINKIQKCAKPELVKCLSQQLENNNYSTGKFKIYPGEYYLITINKKIL